MKSQNVPTMPARRKLLVAGAGTRSLDAITIQGQRLPDAVQVYSDVEAPMKS